MFDIFRKTIPSPPASDGVEKLHATLVRRETPETVAAVVKDALGTKASRALEPHLGAVIRASMTRRYGWSSMSTVFRAPPSAERHLAKARELAQKFLNADLPAGDDPEALDAVADELSRLIGKPAGIASFKDQRLSRADRSAVGLELSHRRYNKLFRLANRLQAKADAIRNQEVLSDLVLISKAGFAGRVTLQDLGGHAPTAAFVAYYSARMKLRSEFTISGQQRPFDELSAALLKLCDGDPETRWQAIAHVFPRADVLSRLSEEEKGRLLGEWFEVLTVIAERLERIAGSSNIDLDSMIVRRGNDSTTWNALAGAWNKARDHWIALVHSLGMDGLFDTVLPGKVMRLMAADVAYWHQAAGGGIHPDTLVWRRLPKPWSVVRGDATCVLAEVEEACRQAGVDGLKSGWTAPRSRTSVATFRATPELVHGVSIANPFLAHALRRIGAFSGKGLKLDAID